ncbi:MAG: hypothetical protein ACI97A_003813 [Planctomycetota bacterium]|jgi:hypothetical protein
MKKKLITLASMLGAVLLLTSPLPNVSNVAVAAEPVKPNLTKLIEPILSDQDRDPQVQDSLERALAYLAENQDSASGGWLQDVGFKFNDRYELSEANKPHVGVTALTLMAFLAGGNLPGRGKYGHVVERGLEFVLSCVDTDTGFISAHETRMYSHAFASLFLAEIYGMTRQPDLQAKLQQAIDLTVETQNAQGAWRYRPYAPDSDMSIAVCQLMALRAARNVGIQVPRSTISKAYKYIRKSAHTQGRQTGAFRYQIDQQTTRVSFALASAGLAALLHAGYYNDDLLKPGLRWLRRRITNLSSRSQENFPTYFYWYGHYYAAQVMFIASDNKNSKKLWDEFYWPRMRKELLRSQEANGSWRNDPGPGDIFGTAVASIILQIPNRYLPIFQR